MTIENRIFRTMLFSSLVWASVGVVHATEGGGGAYPNGTESFLVGAMPPPGNYLVSYNQFYHADKFKNDHPAFDNFDVTSRAHILRGIHISDKKFLGANWGMHAFLVYADVDLELGGAEDRLKGAGDLIVDPFLLGWHSGNWHWATGLELVLPVGAYDKRRLVNVGRNYATVQPVFAFTYLNPQGYELSMKWMFDYNFKNDDTDYRSGNEAHVDFIVAKHWGPLAVGVGGYAYRQVTGDSGSGAVLGDFKGRAYSLGPQLRYQFDQFSVTAKYQQEFDVVNKPEGNKFALDFAFSL